MSYIGNPISIMDYPVDYFTGDGTSTTFQLSRIPASATSILVHIGGVKQVASTTDPAYYLDGSKLVFVSPPGAYSPIEVNYLGIAGQVNIPGVQSVTQDMLSLQLANTFVYQTTANGATASFTLNAPPVSANSLVVSANGVVQYDYSVNGTNLTFGFTPPVGTFIRVTSLALAQAGVPADGSVTSVKLGANLTITGNTTFDGFAGSPARIRGDMSNATIPSRVAVQTSTTNASTVFTVIPNGSGTAASLNLESDSALTTGHVFSISALTGETRLNSAIRGAGSYVPLTMYTGGSERMRIDPSGNVAIGVTSSTFPLTVQSSSTIAAGNPAVVIQGQSNTERFHIRSAGGAGSGTPVIGAFASRGTIASPTAVQSGDPIAYYQFGGYDGTAFVRGAWMIGYATENYSSTNRGTAIAFSTTPNGSTTIAEGMRLDHNGNLGIGTTSPAVKLDIASATGATRVTSTTGTNAVYSYLVNTGGGFYIGRENSAGSSFGSSAYASVLYSEGNYPMAFFTNGSEKMRITSGGNVGINTGSPTQLLDVAGNAAITGTGILSLQRPIVPVTNQGTPQLVFQYYTTGTTYTTGAQIQGLADGNWSSTSAPTNILFYTCPSASTTIIERMRITSDGNIGIGTTSPSTRLTVGRVDTSNEGGQIDLCRASDNASAWAVDVFGSTSTPSFRIVDNVAASARMVIDSSGRVTMPAQPAVEVSRTSNFAVTSNEAVGTVVPFSNETLDVGNNFDQGGTNRFTAPVAGKYQFHWSYGCNISNSTVYRTYLWINGTRREDSQLRNDNSKSGSAYSWGSRTLIISLSANDYVELRASSDTGTDFYADNNLRISMGITLIS